MTSSSKKMQSAKGDLIAYRIVAPKYAKHALSGEGARLYGGRWNSIGRPMVYLASTRALAALELLVHLTTPEARIIPRSLIEVRIPKRLIGGRLWTAEGWREEPPAKPSTDQGDDWLKHGKTTGVAAPSVIIPQEDNILLNPHHPDFSEVEVIETKPFFFDPRLS